MPRINGMTMFKHHAVFSLMLCASTVICTQHSGAKNLPASELKVLHDRPVSWMRTPRVNFLSGDLEGRPRSVKVDIDADSSGYITSVKIITSSGLPDLDNMVIQAVKKARFRPYTELGIRYPFRVTQPFEFQTDDYTSTRKSVKSKPIKRCQYSFETEGWQRQQSGQHSAFQYIETPIMKLTTNDLEVKEFNIHFNFSLDRKNRISDIQLKQSTGSEYLALLLLNQFSATKIEAPRKFYQIFKFQFEEKIQLKNIQCN